MALPNLIANVPGNHRGLNWLMSWLGSRQHYAGLAMQDENEALWAQFLSVQSRI